MNYRIKFCIRLIINKQVKDVFPSFVVSVDDSSSVVDKASEFYARWVADCEGTNVMLQAMEIHRVDKRGNRIPLGG